MLSPATFAPYLQENGADEKVLRKRTQNTDKLFQGILFLLVLDWGT